MHRRVPAIGTVFAGCVAAAAAFGQSSTIDTPSQSRYLPQYTTSGELVLPKDYRTWVYVGSPLTPNALNGSHAAFPEYHNVYIEPGSVRNLQKNGRIPGADDVLQGIAAHAETRGESGRLADRALGTGLLPWCPRWRRSKHQRLEAFCDQWRLGILRVWSF